MQDPNSGAVYEYDSRNRLISETKTIDGTEYTISYAYDAASHPVSMTYPDGTIVQQSYDNVGRVTSVNGYADYLWSETELQQIMYANDVTTTYNYDVRGRPTQIHAQKNGSDLLNLAYTYDAGGNILQMKNTENVNGQQIVKEQWDYTYDSLNRLRTAVGNSYSFTYTYDSPLGEKLFGPEYNRRWIGDAERDTPTMGKSWMRLGCITMVPVTMILQREDFSQEIS